MSVTNEQRHQIRQLIERRINAKRESLLASSPERESVMADVEAQANALFDPLTSDLKAAEENEVHAKKVADIERDSIRKILAKHPYLPVSSYPGQRRQKQTAYPSLDGIQQTKEGYVKDQYQAAVLLTDIGDQITGLDKLTNTLDELTILVTTDTQLRKLVEKVNEALGTPQEFSELLPTI